LKQWLETDIRLPKKQRRTAQRLFEGLQTEGYRGAYDSVQRFVKLWKIEQKTTPTTTQAFIPLTFPPGESCQFDWSEELVELGGQVRKIKVGHFRLCYSRKMFIVACPCETQEMVLGAHIRAFLGFGGVPLRMIPATAPALPYLLHPCSRTTIRKPSLIRFLWVRNASLIVAF
jgi:transposase